MLTVQSLTLSIVLFKLQVNRCYRNHFCSQNHVKKNNLGNLMVSALTSEEMEGGSPPPSRDPLALPAILVSMVTNA